jgi:hypothetical protein
MTNPDPNSKRTSSEAFHEAVVEAGEVALEMGRGLKHAGQTIGIVALAGVDAFESYVGNEYHRWVPQASKRMGVPLMIVGGAVAVFGIKGVATAVGARAIFAGAVALAGKGTLYRGFRAVRPRQNGVEPPVSTPL